MYLPDTNVWVVYLRGKSPLKPDARIQRPLAGRDGTRRPTAYNL